MRRPDTGSASRKLTISSWNASDEGTMASSRREGISRAGKIVRLLSARLIAGDEGFYALFQVAARRGVRIGLQGHGGNNGLRG